MCIHCPGACIADVVLHEQEVDADLVQCGDVLRVLPGASIPVDGVVVGGLSSVNESMVTGWF